MTIAAGPVHGPEPEADAFNSCLAAWEKAARPAERMPRQVAAAALRHARLLNTEGVELYGLTSLPDCFGSMPMLQSLSLNECSMACLPALPPALTHFEARGLQLEQLPDLPHSLVTLIVGPGLLTALPPLPPALQHLDVRKNRLTSLLAPGQSWPSTLLHIDASGNALASLPPLPDDLDELFVQDNQLTCLPPLPPCLGWLVASNNALTSVPPLPASLRKLYLDHNALQDLPDTITRIRSCYTIDVEHNPLPAEVLDRVNTQLRLRPGQPLRMHYNLPPNSPERRRPYVFLVTGAELHEPPLTRAALLWYARSGNIDAAAFERCRTQWRTVDESAALQPDMSDLTGQLCNFLQRLEETEEYRDQMTRAAFNRRVVDLLDALGADTQLRGHVVAIATEALGSCADRIAISLDQMELARMTLDAQRGTTDRATLIALGKDLFKVALLDSLASAYARANPRGAMDEVEVQLAFRTKLGDRLHLPTQTRRTRYAEGVNLNANTLSNAWNAVRTALADPLQIAEFLADWAPWQAHVEQNDAPALATARAALDAEKERLQARLEDAMAHLENAQTKSGEFCRAAFKAQARIGALHEEFNRLERVVMRPVQVEVTQRILQSM